MSTYVRAPLGFKEHLAGIADTQKPPKALIMARLAESLKKSLSTFECAGVIVALDSGDGRGIAELSISQRNALFCLIACNERELLREFFKGE